MAGNPNPYSDPGPWGFVEVGGMRLPGVVRSIDSAERPEEWAFQKGTGSSGATSVWKGTKLAEGITILLEAPNEAAFADLYILRDILRPKIGSQPPTLPIVNPAINFNGITRIASALIGQPKPAANLSWQISLKLCEFNPSKPTNTGPAKPSDYTNPDSKKSANDKYAEELEKLLKGA